MTLYKVTDEQNLSFVAAHRSILPYFKEHFVLKYEIGKITKPKMGKIFCFDGFKYAEEFVGTKPYKIYECEAEKSKDQRTLRVGIDFIDSGNLLHYWLYYENFLKHESVLHPILRKMPDHTVLCDWVKPIKLIKEMKI